MSTGRTVRMLSRAATSLTLLGRHLERADHLARILGVHVALSLDRTDEPGPDFWTRFMELAGWPGGPGGSPIAADRALRAGQRFALAGAGRQLATGPVSLPDERPAERPAGGRVARGHDVP